MATAHQDGNDRLSGAGNFGAGDPRTAIDAPASTLLSSPLEFLSAEHLRQRQFAKLITLIADGVINRQAIAGAIAFIEVDLAQHILDEEMALFPMLKRACEPDDKVDDLLDLLAEEHKHDEAASAKIMMTLRRMAVGEEPSATECAALRDFADHLRRHLALENGVLLPLAEARMAPETLKLLSEAMRVRREALPS